jgi:hypothetical protein
LTWFKTLIGTLGNVENIPKTVGIKYGTLERWEDIKKVNMTWYCEH